MSVLSATGVSVRLGERQVLDRVDLELPRGELLGLVGPNGAGKSTLLRVLAGLLRAESGTILWEGRDLLSLARRQRARTIAYLPQSAPVHWELTVATVVELGRLPWRRAWRPDPRGPSAVEHALQEAGLEELANRSVTTLSGGERMRVMLARLLAGESELLLADEPVAALDLAHQHQVMRLLEAQARNERCVIAVLHDLSLAARFCDRLVLIDDGRIVAAGTPEEVLDPALLTRVYGVLVRRIEHEGAIVILPWAESQ